MSTLIVHLSLASDSAASKFRYTLSTDGQRVERHGAAEPGLLPATGRAGEVLAMVPARALSWQRVQLPPGVSPQSPRLRSVLEGLLEDRLLDEPTDLHFALEPGARAGQNVWVAVCHRARLHAELKALEAAGRPATRVVPELAPEATRAFYVLGSSPSDAQLACNLGPEQGVIVLPLAAAPLVLPTESADDTEPEALFTEPALATLTEQALGYNVQLCTEHQRALQAAQGAWDLAQIDLASSAQTRRLRKATTLASNLLRAPQWRAARWGAVALVLVQLAGLNAWAWQERRALADKKASVRNALTQTFPSIKVVIDAPVQMEHELAKLRQMTGNLAPRDLEALLSAAAQALPLQQPPTAIDYSPGQLQLRGAALPPEAQNTAESQLRRTGHSLHVEADSLIVRASAQP